MITSPDRRPIKDFPMDSTELAVVAVVVVATALLVQGILT